MNRLAKYITFEMSNRQKFTVTRDQAEQILKGAAQFYPINHPDGEWTGQTINKAHIVDTQPDWSKQDAEIEASVRVLDNKIGELSPRADAQKIEALVNARKVLWYGRVLPILEA